jgi:hypothetical protein
MWIKKLICRFKDHLVGPRDWASIHAELIDTGNASISCCKRCGKVFH